MDQTHFHGNYGMIQLLKYMLLCCCLFSTRASADIIYAYVGQPMVHLPCSILKARETALNPTVESMWARYNGSVYRPVILRDKEGTRETFRIRYLGEDTIYPNKSYKNGHFYHRVNMSASRGLIIYNVQLLDAGKFLCQYEDRDVSDNWKVELVVFHVTTPTPAPSATSSPPSGVTTPTPAANATSSPPSGDHINTEGSLSCGLWKALSAVGFGLFGAVLLFINRNKVRRWIKLCLPNTSQDGSGSQTLELHSIEEHDAQSQSGDIITSGKSHEESEGTNGFGQGDGEVTPRTPHKPHTTLAL